MSTMLIGCEEQLHVDYYKE